MTDAKSSPPNLPRYASRRRLYPSKNPLSVDGSLANTFSPFSTPRFAISHPVMIRLPASRILLSSGDLKDFERRQRRRRAIEARMQAADLEEHMHLEFDQHEDLTFQELALRNRDFSDLQHLPAERMNSGLRIKLTQEKESGDGAHIGLLQEEIQSSNLEHSAITNLSEQEHGHNPIDFEASLRKPPLGLRRLSSPSKHDFQYGGFVESPAQELVEHHTPFLPFTPNEHPTPNNLSATEPPRHRGSRLPRSPLFLSQNLSSPRDRRQTAGLIPRVTSRVATHSTPGIIFSQPARRPPRHSATAFRHQTNSFSFDSSERASAAYEQRASSSSTTESIPRPPEDLNLHEELLGISLQESSSESESASSAENSFIEHPSSRQNEFEQSIRSQRDFIFSSPQLPLPPPFSAGSRNSSGAGVLPSVSSPMSRHPLTSPIRSSPSSPMKDESGLEGYDELSDSIILGSPGPEASSSNGGTPRNLIQRTTRVFSAYRSRNSSNHGSSNHPSPSPSPTFQQDWPSRVLGARTPSSSYHVYDDSRPTYSQPQTPAHLPEARHQSRYHPSMTAPVARSHSISVYRPTRPNDHHEPSRRQLSFATPSRSGVGRTHSPVGLRTRGFEGLYGGRENGDEEQNWADGVRFNGAGVRLWGLRDARNDGRSMRETPEPEEWRVGRGT